MDGQLVEDVFPGVDPAGRVQTLDGPRPSPAATTSVPPSTPAESRTPNLSAPSASSQTAETAAGSVCWSRRHADLDVKAGDGLDLEELFDAPLAALAAVAALAVAAEGGAGTTR